MSGFWLFSYGSNHAAQLADRIGRQVTDGQRAVLKGYQRVFRGWSVRWDGGVASLEPKRGATTYGWAAKLTAAELAKLDVYEGVASGHYARSVVKIDLPDLGKKNVTAIAYVSRDPEHHAPSEAYLEACARTVGEWWSEAGRPVASKDFPIRNNPPGCRIVSLTTEEPELRQDARSLFAKIDIRYDDSEDLYEACVGADGSVVGASTLGLYDETPDDADDLRRPRWRFSVVVDEAARRQGIAKALVESIARAHPREKVFLEGKVVNPHMATLLKGLGFYYYEQPEDEIEWGEHERSWGHRMYRPNPDDRLRQLERARAAGDLQAGYALHAERLRAGLPLMPDETLDHVPMWPTAFVRFDRYYFTPTVGVQVAWRGPGVLQGGPWHDPNTGTESVTFAEIEHDRRRGWNETQFQWTKPVSEVQTGLVDAYRNLTSPEPYRGNPPARDDRRYRFVTTCVSSTMEDIHALQDSGRGISRATFVRKLAPGEWKEVQQRLGYDRDFSITRDWHVGYYRGVYRGMPAVWLEHSRIEHIFTLDGKQGPSAGRERVLATNPDADLRALERAAAMGDRDAVLALHVARQRAGVTETGEQALEYLLASGAAVRVFCSEFGNTQQLLAVIGCGYLGDGAASPDGMWWSRGHPDAERQLPGAWARFYRDWVVVLDEDVDPTIRARLAALRTPAHVLAHMVASFPGRLPSLARALELARDLARPLRLRVVADRSAASQAWAEMTPAEEAEFAAEWQRYVQGDS